MSLELVPLLLILAGLTAYTVLGGADFGAGFWRLTARGRAADDVAEHTHNAIAPVWEANHVWLIFVLVVCWTAYPEVFGSITSTLAAALLLAAIGIIFRGTTYAMHGAGTRRTRGIVDAVFGISSVLTPFALGAAIGGIASQRVPEGNAGGDLLTSWLNATSVLIGVLAVATAAYLAAVWLAADATRIGNAQLVEAFRRRAIAAGIVAGALALLGLLVVREDAEALWDGLTSAPGILAVIGSALAGAATLWLVWARRFEPARYTAAAAVGAIVTGWALAQSPELLPGVSVDDAAASDGVIIALLASIAVGLVVLVPSLSLLFGLTLRGRFDPGAEPGPPTEQASAAAAGRPIGKLAVALLVVAVPAVLISDGGPVLAVGVVALLGGLGLAFTALAGGDRLGELRD